jgi:diguanylate cyclase
MARDPQRAARSGTPAVADPLTALPSRAWFTAELAEAVAARRSFAVILFDVDEFKLVNDTLGHAAGDLLITVVTRRALAATRASDVVVSLGGDEFGVLALDLECDGALELAERIRVSMLPPVSLDGHERHITISAGIRCWTAAELGVDAHALVRDADTAMYEAKAAGRNQVRAFSEETRARVLRAVDIEQGLRRLLSNRGLEVHYQPVVDLHDGTVTGVEALARWPGGPSPTEFIPIAERTGLISRLGRQVLEEACRQFAVWRELGLDDLTLSVNLSPTQLLEAGVAERLYDELRRHGIPAHRLCLEITESGISMSNERIAAALEAVAAGGAFLALDDFGTGHSSLSRLRDLPAEVVKIDQSFVAGLGARAEDTAIVASIMSLAHAMGLHVVAEGVETLEQARELVALGCTAAQGFLFSPPVPAAELPALCAAGSIPALAELRGRRSEPAPSPARHHAHKSLVVEMMHVIGIPIGEPT